MTISVRFAWYDFWIGAYWDRRARVLYVCPVPCVVVRMERCPVPDPFAPTTPPAVIAWPAWLAFAALVMAVGLVELGIDAVCAERRWERVMQRVDAVVKAKATDDDMGRGGAT